MIDSTDNQFAGGGENQGPLRRRRRHADSAMQAQSIDRLPPHSIEAEQGVLGCILLEPNESIGACIEKLTRGEEAFYDMRHQALFDLLVEMYDRKEPIEPITVQQYLRDRHQLEAIGGMPYIAGLMNSVPSAASLEHYLEIIREKAVLRKMIQTCTGAVAKVYDHQGECDALLDEVQRDVLAIMEDRVKQGTKPIRELVHSAIEKIEAAHQSGGALTGVPTGYPDLDKKTRGLKPGEMIVIAARPSMGKTSLAMNIVEHVAIEQGMPVGVFSLEMTAESLVYRMLCSRARVNLHNVSDGFLCERDFPKLTGAAGKLANAPVFVDDIAGLSILQLRAKARRMHQRHGIKLFVIDYLQLLNATGSRTAARSVDNRQQEVALISGGIKALAKELDVPVIVLCQLNRELDKDKNRKPRLSDLRESGAIEQDADLVGLLYRPERDEESSDGSDVEAIPINLLIAKQRNGPTGDVHLTFLKGYTRFESASKVADVDYAPRGRDPYSD